MREVQIRENVVSGAGDLIMAESDSTRKRFPDFFCYQIYIKTAGELGGRTIDDPRSWALLVASHGFWRRS